MKFNRILVLVLSVMLFTGCGEQAAKKKALKKIADKEAVIFKDSTAVNPKGTIGMEMIQAYTDYANAWPKDTISAEFLFKGAEIAMNLNQSGMAIDYYNRILLNYPDYSRRPYCMFLQAYILENQMKKYDLAKTRYQEFLDTYPKHPLAESAQAAIINMGKPIEELIKEWESKNPQ